VAQPNIIRQELHIVTICSPASEGRFTANGVVMTNICRHCYSLSHLPSTYSPFELPDRVPKVGTTSRVQPIKAPCKRATLCRISPLHVVPVEAEQVSRERLNIRPTFRCYTNEVASQLALLPRKSATLLSRKLNRRNISGSPYKCSCSACLPLQTLPVIQERLNIRRSLLRVCPPSCTPRCYPEND
jgi:hypothetical protein